MNLRNALYSTRSEFFRDEIVIDTDHGGSEPATSGGTGFILKEVEGVMIEIRTDLDIVPGETEYSGVPLMVRLRSHTDEIGKMLTGGTMTHPSDGLTTISQLILDINRLRMSVENETTRACIIL
tara:strand:- start:857 stop:1228 length:372 start_codon:yes stop_codon:yes gene_type:complete